VVDGQGGAGIRGAQPDRAARDGPHGEDRRADLVALLRGGIDGREEEEVVGAAGAGAARHRDAQLGHEERPRPLERLGLALEGLGGLVAEADADVVVEALADGEPALGADAAAKQDPRRAVRAGGEHHRARADLARRGRDPRGAFALEEDAVDQRVGRDGQVLAAPGGIEVGEGRVPPDRPDRVQRVQDRVGARGLGERAVPRRELLRAGRAHAQLARGPPQVWLVAWLQPSPHSS